MNEYAMNISPSGESKMRSPDRILMLEQIEGKTAKQSSGSMIDPSLFKEGGNRLHCVMDPETCLWTFKYEKGMVPPMLKGSWTGFRAAKKYAEDYFGNRNIRVSEVKD